MDHRARYIIRGFGLNAWEEIMSAKFLLLHDMHDDPLYVRSDEVVCFFREFLEGQDLTKVCTSAVAVHVVEPVGYIASVMGVDRDNLV